ncbi:MAG: hypothetical protein EA392_13935 [Cryomorphaceae bacterium]|nr:MAG: hypothetical protein EA392_13935 [Cryomorphaceae bacterium]
MANQLINRQDELLRKQAILQEARRTLKEEFVGLNEVIDKVVDAISSWYLFPDLQEKPVIVNLWGLTGVGKSSLVKRLSQLLQFEKRFYHFDIGEDGKGEYTIKTQLENIYDHENGFPVMLALDEFQHARTIDEAGIEMTERQHRIIWQLLDSGRFQIHRFSYGVSDLYNLMIDLNLHLMNGVKVTNGFVSEKAGLFRIRRMQNKVVDQADEKERKENIDLMFVPASYYEKIYDLARENFDSFLDVRAQLLELDGPGTVNFLREVLSFIKSPKEVDCSKGLVFVLGNLDEAYTMSKNLSSDIDADEFYRASLQINIPEIKDALQLRFRSEQIGRLGNTHIVYPSLSKKAFQAIIAMELDAIARKVHAAHGVTLKFQRSLHQLLYREGVYPTQGTRPVYTTIYQLVNARLGSLISEMITRSLTDCHIVFKASKKGVVCDFVHDGKRRHSVTFNQRFALDELRQSKCDDVQAITAVHEAGHAVLSVILMRSLPEVVYSTTAEVGNNGFSYTRYPWQYISRKEIIRRLAVTLGGHAAEELVFGKDNVTTGASGDVRSATEFAARLIRSCMMGSQIGHFNASSTLSQDSVFDHDHTVNREVREWLHQAMELARETLKQQETLLLQMANFLSDARELRKNQIKKMVAQFAVNFNMETLIENGDHLFYRNHLKQKVARPGSPKTERGALVHPEITLNMEKHSNA